MSSKVEFVCEGAKVEETPTRVRFGVKPRSDGRGVTVYAYDESNGVCYNVVSFVPGKPMQLIGGLDASLGLLRSTAFGPANRVLTTTEQI